MVLVVVAAVAVADLATATATHANLCTLFPKTSLPSYLTDGLF